MREGEPERRRTGKKGDRREGGQERRREGEKEDRREGGDGDRIGEKEGTGEKGGTGRQNRRIELSPITKLSAAIIFSNVI